MFTLEEVVPWGRSFEEYERMFALTDADLARSIVGCGDGPTAFNADATRHGVRVVSCDPLYQWGAAEIRGRITATYDQVLDQAQRRQDAADLHHEHHRVARHGAGVELAERVAGSAPDDCRIPDGSWGRCHFRTPARIPSGSARRPGPG